MSTRRRGRAPLFLSLLVASGGMAVARHPAKPKMDIEHGVLDEIHLKVAKLTAGVPVVIRSFGTDNVDFGTGKEGGKEKRVEAAHAVAKEAPSMLSGRMAAALKEQGVFPEVITDPTASVPDRAIVVEGRFVSIDPGSRAKRYWLSFGAGQSGVTVEGRVLDASGKVLAEFKHRKSSGIGIGGGDYFKFLSDDTKDAGGDIAKFLSMWASDKPLE